MQNSPIGSWPLQAKFKRITQHFKESETVVKVERLLSITTGYRIPINLQIKSISTFKNQLEHCHQLQETRCSGRQA